MATADPHWSRWRSSAGFSVSTFQRERVYQSRGVHWHGIRCYRTQEQAMADSFLEDQLKRIREMSERMSQATRHAAELNHELARNREAGRQGPLNEVRDLRTYSPTRESGLAENESSRQRSESDAGNTRRHSARDTSRRRR